MWVCGQWRKHYGSDMCILLHVTYRNNVLPALGTEADSRAQEDHEEADGESGAGQRSTVGKDRCLLMACEDCGLNSNQTDSHFSPFSGPSPSATAGGGASSHPGR